MMNKDNKCDQQISRKLKSYVYDGLNYSCCPILEQYSINSSMSRLALYFNLRSWTEYIQVSVIQKNLV